MSRLGRILGNPSLLTRVAVMLAVVGLMPVGLLASRLIGINRQSMADQVDRTHILTARKTAEGVGTFIDTRLALAEGLAASADLRDARSAPARDLLRRSLDAWKGLGVLALAVVNREGEQVILAQLADQEVRNRVSLLFERPATRDVEAHRPAGRLTIRVRSPLPGEVGHVWLISDGVPLLEVLEASELGREAAMALVDAEGRAILGDAEVFPESLLVQARSGRLVGAAPRFRAGGDGEESVGAYSPVAQAGWLVLSRQSAREARAAELRMRRQSNWALGLSAVLVGLLSAAAYWTAVRPIRGLVREQRRLAGLTAATGGNEIDQLRSSFEILEQRLKERQALEEIRLGRYEVKEVAGSGAMGTVFQCWDPKLQRRVALKTIRLDAELAPKRRRELISRLLDEAVMVAQFSHQNIVAVYDVEDRSDAAFVAMEYIDGESLESRLWREGRLDQDQVVPLGAAIAHALATAHEHGMLHRDVKPANILLGRDGSIKVTDFGISELITSMSGQPDVIFGTPGYLPPESLEGRGYGKSGDLFALGAILYYCVTGRRPFGASSVRETIRATLAGRFTHPRRLLPGIEPELDALIVELLQSDPERRPSDAEEVARRLDRVAERRGARWIAPDPPRDVEPAQPAPAGNAQFVPTQRLDDDGETIHMDRI